MTESTIFRAVASYVALKSNLPAKNKSKKIRVLTGIDIQCRISLVINMYCSLPARCVAQEYIQSALTTTLQSTVPQVPRFLFSAATAKEATRYVRHFSVYSFLTQSHSFSWPPWEIYLEMSRLSANP